MTGNTDEFLFLRIILTTVKEIYKDVKKLKALLLYCKLIGCKIITVLSFVKPFAYK